MTRRTALMAVVAAMGQVLMDEQELTAQTSNIGVVTWLRPERLTVHLGGSNGYKQFDFTDGKDTVTFTAQELMAALRETR